jgi:hypothetical protein
MTETVPERTAEQITSDMAACAIAHLPPNTWTAAATARRIRELAAELLATAAPKCAGCSSRQIAVTLNGEALCMTCHAVYWKGN